MTIVAFYVRQPAPLVERFDIIPHGASLSMYAHGDPAIDGGDWAGLQTVAQAIEAELWMSVAPNLEFGAYSDIDHNILLEIVSRFKSVMHGVGGGVDSFYVLFFNEWDVDTDILYISGELCDLERYINLNCGWEAFCMNIRNGVIGKRYYDPLLCRVMLRP